jgi:hypothetical protein
MNEQENKEKRIIWDAVHNALCFGVGLLTAAKEQIELYDLCFCAWHEEYAMSIIPQIESKLEALREAGYE